MRCSTLLSLSLLSLTSHASAGQEFDIKPSPQVGEVAPEFGDVHWRQLPDKKPPSMKDLRGQVVVVHTWVWYCDSCVKTGVPAVVDTVRSNTDQDLVVISLQGMNQRDDVADDHWLGIGQELGMTHALGETSYFGEYSPYFNLNENSSPTYGFVIDRAGLVRWRGDLASKSEDFFVELRAALEAPAPPPMPAGLGEEFAGGLLAMAQRDRTKAIKEITKVQKAHIKSSRPEKQAIAAQAMFLLEELQIHADSLVEAATTAVEADDAEGYARATRELKATYARSPQLKELKKLEKVAKAVEGFLDRVEAWEDWLDLAAERPATFPARSDKLGEKYARKLRKYVSASEELPGKQLALGWLSAVEE